MNEATKHEARRYENLYAAHGYPSGHPERVTIWAGVRFNDAVLDLGCGRATLARIFERYTGVDFTSAGFPQRRGAGQNFYVAALDDLPAEIMERAYDAAICADVMEHVITADVPSVLSCFNKINARRFIFAICCRPSNWKDEHGGLHLTVRQPNEWLRDVKRCMPSWQVESTAMDGATVFIKLCRL